MIVKRKAGAIGVLSESNFYFFEIKVVFDYRDVKAEHSILYIKRTT